MNIAIVVLGLAWLMGTAALAIWMVLRASKLNKKYEEAYQAKMKEREMEFAEAIEQIPNLSSEKEEQFREDVEQHKVSVGMTEQLAELIWGEPDYIDQHRETQTYQQYRLVYGQPRTSRGANYVIVRDSLVHRVDTNYLIRLSSPRKGNGYLESAIFGGLLLIMWTAVFCTLISNLSRLGF